MAVLDQRAQPKVGFEKYEGLKDSLYIYGRILLRLYVHRTIRMRLHPMLHALVLQYRFWCADVPLSPALPSNAVNDTTLCYNTCEPYPPSSPHKL